MSHKLVKEDFVSNLNGTTLLELSVILPIPPLCLLSRGLLLTLYFLHHGTPLHSKSGRFLLDFTVLVIPSLLLCTIFAPVLPAIVLFMTVFCAGLIFKIYSRRTNYVKVPLEQILRDFLRTNLKPKYIPSISVFRAYMNVLTSINILAVDFPQYPRRYAKTETYGTGLMDFGVGAFVFGNAVVCPEVRLKPGAVQRNSFYLTKQFSSVWPLLLLGFGRLMSVKAIDYHEHTSEYGVHWNFFFTLASVRITASLLLTAFPVRKAWIVAVTLAVGYECFLSLTPLKMFIMHGSNGQGSRTGFLNANREGLFSIAGYLAIYMASVQVGLFLLRKRSSVREWFGVICSLLLTFFLLFICLNFCQTYVDTTSRRMGNLSFCLWIVAYCLLLFGAYLLADLALVFAKLLVDGATVPASWNIVPLSETNKKQDSETNDRKPIPQDLCLITAVNRNQLLYFLLANILTGFTNMLVDTIHSRTFSAMFVLHLYMFANVLIMYMLQAKNIVVKWW
ncbi:phosphatidylinositol-glycan biosynthesis class W protein [Tiliqua scincoides]|uniref:phosphatidylinositol-glycan biosynthesis class W protein n=1 Tax=Tiliqua scincoides TaxID=71010 RepID=UPI003463218C